MSYLNIAKSNFDKPALLFCLGWCLVMMFGWLPFVPDWNTFIHPSRVELAASIFFLTICSYLLYNRRGQLFSLTLPRAEFGFVILPMLAFITWSAFSATWATSWKASIYHTLVWTLYLIFYLVIRHLLGKPKIYPLLLSLLTVIYLIICIPGVIEYCQYIALGGYTTIGFRYEKYGEQINTIYPLIAVGVLRLSGKRFVIGWSLLVVMCLFIIASLGRTNVVLFVGATISLTVLIFSFRRFRKYRLKMATVFAGMLLAPFLMHSAAYFNEQPSAPAFERFVNAKSIMSSSGFRQLAAGVSLEMFEENWLRGVGAGNFGIHFNEYRARYAAENPNDVKLALAENEIPERSHNEYLQILAELGFVGGAIFLWFLSGVGLMVIRIVQRRKQISLFACAALLGTTIFLISSVATSFSFRLVQHGFLFMLVLAVTAKLLFNRKSEQKAARSTTVSPGVLKFGYTLGAAACLVLAIHCSLRAASVHYTNLAKNQKDAAQAALFYETAVLLDNENPEPHFYRGLYLLLTNKYAPAVPEFEQSIKLGRGSSMDYSFLASAQKLAGDPMAAEQTFAHAVKIFPRSIFVKMRYADLLQANGKNNLSISERQTALQINEPQARGWYLLINEGAEAAGRAAILARLKQTTPSDAPMDLIPQNAVYAICGERETINPQEKSQLNFK